MFPGTDGWGESGVDEVVEHLESVYQHRDQAQRRATAAAVFMQDWTWKKQVARLVAACGLTPESGGTVQA